MSRSIDITNRRFGRLTAIKRVEDYIAPSGSHAERWECACDCGNKTTVTKACLTKGGTLSCGCYRREKRIKAQQYEIKDDLVYMESTKGKTFIVDKSDLDIVQKYHWHISKNGYVVRNSDKKPLHKILIPTDERHVVDHINQNRLDNRRCNLRVTSYSVNGYNKTIKAGKSGEPFIAYNAKAKYYSVVIDGKYIGGSNNLQKAIAIRNEHLKESKVYKYNLRARELI